MTYLSTASTWHAFVHGASRRAAQPVLQQFGLPLSADGGKRLRDFLASLRLRLEIRDSLIAAVGPAGVPDAVDDESLITLFRQHYSALKATAEMDRVSVPASARAGGVVQSAGELVARLAAVEGAAAAKAFAFVELDPTPENGLRLRAFIPGLIVRLILQEFYRWLIPEETTGTPLIGDAELSQCVQTHAALLRCNVFQRDGTCPRARS